MIACVTSVSVWFRSNERPRNGIFGLAAREMAREQKMKEGGGEGRKLLQTNPASERDQRTGRLIGSASRTLLTCVDQKFVSYREVVTRI